YTTLFRSIESVARIAHGAHHRVGNVVVGVRPGVDHLVVALAVRDVAGLICLLEPVDPLLRLTEECLLLGRDVEVFDSDGDSTARGVPESEFLQTIEERNRSLQPTLAVALEHELAERLFLHLPVLESNLLRDDGVEEDAAYRRVDPPVSFDVLHEVADGRVERHSLL